MVFKISFGSRAKADSDDAKRALTLLSGELARLPFEASDPASVEAAIARADAIIDEKIAPYRDNPIVKAAVKDLKEKIHRSLREKASQTSRT